MLEGPNTNKAMQTADVKTKDSQPAKKIATREYFFPDYNVKVIASSIEEAGEKLLDIIKNK